MEVCGTVEQAMASQQPFGDDIHILDRRCDHLTGQLEELVPALPEAADLLDAMASSPNGDRSRLLTETTLRSAIAHAHRQLIVGAARGRQLLRVADCAAILTTAAGYLQRGGTATPLHDNSLVRLGVDHRHGWIWRDEHPDDSYGRAFRELIAARYRMQPSTPDARAIEMLTTGARLLGELLPSLAPSALHHAHTVACVPTATAFFGSSSRPDLGGVLFLRESLGNPWWVAEHLLHESMHLKLYDLLGAETLVGMDGQHVERPVVTPWNPSMLSGANRWHAWRVLAALHVYVHLALLSSVAERRAAELEGSYGPLSDMLDSRRALARAHYLGAQLAAHQQCWDTLGPFGQRLAEWLRSLLAMLNPDTDADGTLHLYLDRYHRETDRLNQLLAAPSGDRTATRAELAALARGDMSTTRTILFGLGARRQLAALNADLDRFTDAEIAHSYPEIRDIIEACLLDASPDGYRLSESGDADTQVAAMVDRASDTLFALSARIPAPVAAAKRRAVDLRSFDGCSDDLGRFLATQAAHLPTGAAILEIGCGSGIVTAWLVAGLGSRTDVRIETIDAETVPATAPFAFDLVLADASAITADVVAAMVDALPAGAMLIVHNTGATTPTAPQRTILDDDRFVATEMGWGGGLLIATKLAARPT